VSLIEVAADLGAPCVPFGPILLDAVALAGLGGEMGSREASGRADSRRVCEASEQGGLPFARVEAGGAWWYAVSAAIPEGIEEVRHLHRRIPQGLYERYTDVKNVNIATGPDKSLRIPQYQRPEWMTVRWLCHCPDPERLARLLWRVGAIGRVTTHGNGWVLRWRLSTGQICEPFNRIIQGEPWEVTGPDVAAFADDLRLRHLPVERVRVMPQGRLQRRIIPLRPPYHTGYDADASRAVACWQWGGA
jgi:hypothetical protein